MNNLIYLLGVKSDPKSELIKFLDRQANEFGDPLEFFYTEGSGRLKASDHLTAELMAEYLTHLVTSFDSDDAIRRYIGFTECDDEEEMAMLHAAYRRVKKMVDRAHEKGLKAFVISVDPGCWPGDLIADVLINKIDTCDDDDFSLQVLPVC